MGFFPGMKHCTLFNGGCSLLASSNVKKIGEGETCVSHELFGLMASRAVTKFSWTLQSPYTYRGVSGPLYKAYIT